MKQWLMIWDAQDIHHQLIVSVSIRSKCHYIKHPDMLTLVSCKSERCTWTGQMCCGCSAHQSQGLSASDELGWAADFIISWWRVMSRVSQSAASKCHPLVLVLMFHTSERCTWLQSTSVTRCMCVVWWSNGWWAGICIIFQLMMFYEHTYFCLHWCYADLRAVLGSSAHQSKGL